MLKIGIRKDIKASLGQVQPQGLKAILGPISSPTHDYLDISLGIELYLELNSDYFRVQIHFGSTGHVEHMEMTSCGRRETRRGECTRRTDERGEEGKTRHARVKFPFLKPTHGP